MGWYVLAVGGSGGDGSAWFPLRVLPEVRRASGGSILVYVGVHVEEAGYPASGRVAQGRLILDIVGQAAESLPTWFMVYPLLQGDSIGCRKVL